MNDTVITGAIIGFFIWTAGALVRVIYGLWLPVRIPEWSMIALTGTGAAIGWLVS